jgi:tRNA nucleotidyltransferase (CCA-adding enzyme)
MSGSGHDISAGALPERIAAIPAVVAVREAAGDMPAYLVGGGVRDLLLGLDRVDLDVAVEAPAEDVAELARRVDPDARVHDRFGTATVRVGETEVDLAATRAESYERPGALPSVQAAGIADDLARRDFSVNAMAVPLAGEAELVDPHGGLDDLGETILRALHDRSFADDPTRALRAARYAARLALRLDPDTETWLRATDLETVSAERVEAELRRLAAEPDPQAALSLLVEWGLAEANVELAGGALEVLRRQEWSGVADPATAFLAAGSVRAGRFGRLEGGEGGRDLASVQGSRPSELAAAARGRTGVELVIGRALGAEWLDRYVAEWRDVRLEIDGSDLMEAGVEEGPAVGHGLAAALAAKLDGTISGRDEELETALRAARTVE